MNEITTTIKKTIEKINLYEGETAQINTISSEEQNLLNNLALLAGEKDFAPVKDFIHTSTVLIESGSTKGSEALHKQIVEDKNSSVFFCAPLKTWGCKTNKFLYSMFYCKKDYILNFFIRMMESDKKFMESIKNKHQLHGLFLNQQCPNLIAVEIMDAYGEISCPPHQFALFLPEYVNRFASIESNFITLFFPDVYLERHLTYKNKRRPSAYLSKKNILLFLTTWFKGHEYGHYIRHSASENFWNEINKKYEPRDVGALEELLSDLFGVQFSLQFEHVQNDLSSFIEVYLVELELYIDRVLEYEGYWFEDSDAAVIQLTYIKNTLGLSEDNYYETLVNNPTLFKKVFDKLFKDVFSALTSIEKEESENFINQILLTKNQHHELQKV